MSRSKRSSAMAAAMVWIVGMALGVATGALAAGAMIRAAGDAPLPRHESLAALLR